MFTMEKLQELARSSKARYITDEDVYKLIELTWKFLSTLEDIKTYPNFTQYDRVFSNMVRNYQAEPELANEPIPSATDDVGGYLVHVLERWAWEGRNALVSDRVMMMIYTSTIYLTLYRAKEFHVKPRTAFLARMGEWDREVTKALTALVTELEKRERFDHLQDHLNKPAYRDRAARMSQSILMQLKD